jgi:probable rRNA maturation factor
VNITVTAETGRDHMLRLRNHLKQVAQATRPRLKDLTVILASNHTIRRLHKTYMNDASITDVLTFPIDTDDAGKVQSGEVYICVSEARRQARSRNIPMQNELLLYALHGMLHLLGHDDRTAADYRKMHRAEDKILSAIGLGEVFSTPAKRRPR